MRVAKEQKVKEAAGRMKVLGISELLIAEFVSSGKVYCSKEGVCSELGGEYRKLVDEFEAMHAAIVYHLIFTESDCGDLLSMLYVSDYQDEWDMDMRYLREGRMVAYVVNLDIPPFSDLGLISVGVKSGCLFRVL